MKERIRPTIWEIESLMRERATVSLIRRCYCKLAGELQKQRSIDSVDDTDLVQIALDKLWERLPRGTQEEMADISPGRIRSVT